MKRSIYVLTSAVCFALAAGSQVYANLVTNPGFEDAFGTPPEWTFTATSGSFASFGRSTASAYSGSYSYAITHTANGFPSVGYVEQTLSGLPPGATYNVSAWMNFGVGYNRPDKFWAVHRGPWAAAPQSRRLPKMPTWQAGRSIPCPRRRTTAGL